MIKTEDDVIKYIIKFIKDDNKLNDKYYSNHHKRKYKLDDILPIIVYVLKQNISWESISNLKSNINISYQCVYKTYRKLIDDNILYKSYNKIVDEYMKNIYKDGIVYTDTTVIANKYGNENVGRNKYYKNKKITKLSLVTDNNNVIINVKSFSGNINDAKIAIDHIGSLTKYDSIVKYSKKIKTLVADPGYDTSKLTTLMKKYGKTCIIEKNKRNTKDENKLEALKMTKSEMKIYKNRHKIENVNANLKQFKRINVRYDRLNDTYIGFVYLASMYRIIDYI